MTIKPSPARVTPDMLPKPVTDLLAAVTEALKLPIPSTALADGQAYEALLVQRATHVWILLESMLEHPHVAIDKDAADIRAHIEQYPVTYTTFAEQQAQATRQGEGQ
ncbi:hypothetical protein [Streptomyces turgidiscabies]|uniref:hypothetical protein n=1 Tax=Streptomyces turgidiscabies TaxID=85558 RepID=UPI0038F6854C